MSYCAIALLLGSVAFTQAGQLPGVVSYELRPQKVYLDAASNISLSLNITYIDSADGGVDLAQTLFQFSNGSKFFDGVDCSPRDRRGSAQGSGRRAYVIQNCTIPITKNMSPGHYELFDLHVRNLQGEDIRLPNTDLLNAVNRELESALCLPPYFTVTNVPKSNTISVTDIKFNFSVALVDHKEVTLPIRMEFVAPNGLNISSVAFVLQDPSQKNASLLRTLPCKTVPPLNPTDPPAMGPADAPTMGAISCDLFIPKSAPQGTYQLSNILMEDKKGNQWNSEGLSILLTVDSDTSEHHMHSHVGMDGNLFHMHMCSLPRVTVVNEDISCPSSKLLSCMSSNYLCTNESNPPCPKSKSCQMKYKFARCASGMYCYDALSLWCNGGFFAQDKQPGCLDNLKEFCDRVKGNSKCNATKFKECTKVFDTVGKGSDECVQKRQYNLCGESSGCYSLHRDVSKCGPEKIVRPPKPAMALVSEENFLLGTFRNTLSARAEFERRLPKDGARSKAQWQIYIVAGAIVAFVGIGVAISRATRGSTSTHEAVLMDNGL